MQAAADIYLGENQIIKVKGILSFATVPHLRDLGNHTIKTYGVARFDFKEVTRVDSAALALLTAWTRFAKQSGLMATFINLPTQLLDLACLSNLDSILQIETEKTAPSLVGSPSISIVES